MQWIKKGDRNTRFFHWSTMMRLINCIKQLQESDVRLDTAEIKEQASSSSGLVGLHN